MIYRFFLLATLSCFMAVSRPGQAQDVNHYSPYRPTTSPYLNLLRFNTGPLPNYHSFVLPQLEQQRFQRQTELELRENAIRFSQRQPMIEQSGPIGIRHTGVYPTGVHGQYQYYSHYFNSDRRSTGAPRFSRRGISMSSVPRTEARTGQTYAQRARAGGVSY